jgi:hypothetical protein
MTTIVDGTTGVQGSALASNSALTPPTVTDSNGVQIGTFCRAWVKFDGTLANPTVIGGFNVSGVTKQATGKFTITFSNAMPNANYVLIGNTGFGNTVVAPDVPTTTNCSILTYNASGNVNRDATTYLAFFA